MNIQLAGESQDALELIIAVAVPAVVLLACFIVVALLGKAAWASVQFQAGKVRQYVDEPTDTIIVTIDGVGEWLLHRKLDEALISKLMTATIDAIAGTQPPREVTVWTQPTGAHNAYPKGARVLHKDAVWVNQIDANVWEPGSVGAETLWLKEGTEPPVTEPAWKAGVKYTGDNTAGAGKGDVVTYNGRRYRCWQTHTSQVGWEPPKVPALWIDLGPV